MCEHLSFFIVKSFFDNFYRHLATFYRSRCSPLKSVVILIYCLNFRIFIDGEGDLVITNVTDDDEGKYQCLAKNVVGTRSTDKADLRVQGKVIKMGQPRPLFHLFLSFKTHITNFTTNSYVKNVHPVYGAGIRTHDLWNMSFLPKSLDQGSRPQGKVI